MLRTPNETNGASTDTDHSDNGVSIEAQGRNRSIPEAVDPSQAISKILPIENLTERVRQNAPLGSPFDGDKAYDGFFDAVCRALHRTEPRHLLLVRERGVGERAVLIELARRGLHATPPFLRKMHFLAVDCRRIPPQQVPLAMEVLFSSIVERDDVVVCVEGLSNLLRSRGPEDNRLALLSCLATLRCRVIGILAPHEYEEQFAADAECLDLFSVVPLHEPDVPLAVQIVRQFASGLELRYQMRIDDAAVRSAVVLSSSYILHERLPHKAVKLLRSACDDAAYDRSQFSSAGASIGESQIIAKVAQITSVPAETLAGVGERVDYVKGLGEIVVGQDQAVREVAAELGMIKAGLVDAGKPASVMLFIGQTGTGKTELAKALARFYSSSKRLKTFTLGNFSEPHSVSGIIGVPPGYVGHEQGGRLVNELNADPFSVFLLDEADKAHPDVMQPFLNLFDEGWVYDQRGRKAYGDRAIFILTTNVGQRQIADLCKQGKSTDEITWTMKESLSRIRHTKSNRPVFTPEFLARIKRVIVFRTLDAGAMLGICRKLITEMATQWQAKRQKTLQIAEGLIEDIAAQAFATDQKSQGKEGGRIVRKLLSDVVESKLQQAICEQPDAYRAAQVVSVEYHVPQLAQDPDPAPAERQSNLQPHLVEIAFQ